MEYERIRSIGCLSPLYFSVGCDKEKKDGMNTIGLDAHSASFTVAILNRHGKLSLCLRRPTSEEKLIEIVSTVKGPKRPVVEESHLAQWNTPE